MGPVHYSGYQAFDTFLVALSPVPVPAACGLRMYSRRLSPGLGLGEQGRLLTAARRFLKRHSGVTFLAAVRLQVCCRLETLPNLGSQTLGIQQAIFAALGTNTRLPTQQPMLGEANVNGQSYEPDIAGYKTPISHRIRGTGGSSGVT
jgi:hypothetical protein